MPSDSMFSDIFTSCCSIEPLLKGFSCPHQLRLDVISLSCYDNIISSNPEGKHYCFQMYKDTLRTRTYTCKNMIYTKHKNMTAICLLYTTQIYTNIWPFSLGLLTWPSWMINARLLDFLTPHRMACELIADRSSAMWSDPIHEVNWEIDARWSNEASNASRCEWFHQTWVD